MEFLEVFKNSYIQMFDDRKYWDEPKPPLPYYDKVVPMSELVNNQKKFLESNNLGVGICFSPNPSDGGRKVENLTAIEWIYVDMDSGSKPEQMEKIENAPITPSIIIESLRSYHCYWRCDLTKDQFKELIQGLIIYFNGDQAISSPNEVLRLPGFFHHKYKNNPFQIKLLKFEDQKEEFKLMIEAYPKPMDKWKKQYAMGNNDLSVLKDIPIEQVLNKLGIEHKDCIIYEDGEATSARINRKENYINRFSGKPPSGSVIDVVMHYLKTDVKGSIKWLRETFSINIEKKQPPKLEVKENYLKRYTWGTTGLNHTFAIIKRESLIIVYGTRGQGKTTYIFDLANKNALLGHKVLFYSLEMGREALISDLCRRSAGITVEEEYEYKIPDYKQDASSKKESELNNIENLIFKGMRGDSNKSWDAIIAGIAEHKDLDLIIIDNLDLIEARPQEDNNDKQKRIIKGMMAFTTAFKVPIILIHHQRKFSSGKQTSGMDDMSGSGKVPDTADYVVRVIRDTSALLVSPEKYKTTLHLEKARGYCEEMKAIYFHKGSFHDDHPDQVEVQLDLLETDLN